MYPVDLPDVVHTDLAPASERFLSALESRPPAAADGWFEIPPTGKVEINSNNVRRLRPFEDDRPDCAVAALHPPDDPARVVALHLHERWWGVDDVLRTSSESRCGLVAVQTTTERLIVFLLSRVVDGSAQEEALFSPHPCTERCKLLWSGGQAVGFYTVKHKGSLCDSWSGRCYLLPVLDTLLVRRRRRRSGFALRMLEDFCSSFAAEEFLGISAPLSPGMAAGSSCSGTRNIGSVSTRWTPRGAGRSAETSGSTSGSAATPSARTINNSSRVVFFKGFHYNTTKLKTFLGSIVFLLLIL
ncbi:protein FAM169B isoform X1 [Scophthalmus maximus]|uniref:protein FAM169B isoform X1 n=1 Tax=Scophthalmus maximus TaxID=52904 RepID=UPI001FA86F8F|nr:protein FAM169B isoform X1 [Scophthalmus maximus]